MAAVVLDMSMSLDGFVTGPDPREGLPLGEGGQRLHDWMFSRPADSGRSEAADANAAITKELFAATGAVLMGRRIFELGIGPWGGTPFPVPCFVLTHHARDDVVTASGTFSFVTAGLTAALDRAKAAAGGRNVLAHTPDIAQQLLRTGLLDEIQLHLVPILLGAGRRLFENIGQGSGELQQIKAIEAPSVTHLYYRVMR
jgi:dihydrofolate reductase